MQKDRITNLDISGNLSQDIQIEREIKKTPESHPKIRKKEKTREKNIRSFLQISAFIIILILVTVFIRIKTAEMPYFDAIAQDAVERHYEGLVQQEISQSVDILPQEKVKAAEQRYYELLKSREADNLIKQTAENYKASYRDEQGMNYLYGGDAYYYFKQTNDLIEDGVKPKSGIPYVYAWAYRIISMFNPGITIKGAVFYLPVLFGVLSVILIFLITRRLTDDFGGFIAGFFLAINPSFLLNTRAGFIDTNSLNVLLSMLIIYLFLHTIELKKKSIITGLLLILSIFAFKSIWNGWYYIVVILAVYITAFFFIFALVNIFKNSNYKSPKSVSILAGIMAIILGGSYFFIKSGFMKTILARFKLTERFFPSGFITVAELQGYSFIELTQRLGGFAVMFFVLVVIFYLIYKSFRELTAYNEISLKLFFMQFRTKIFVIVYFISMFFIPFFAKRFTTFLVPAFCIALGTGIYLVMPYLTGFIKSIQININSQYMKYLIILIISLFLFLSGAGVLKANMKSIPHMNDAIYNTAAEIKFNSSEGAKINMWWDYGYLYEAVAERDVAFHGGSFNSPRLHWISMAFMTDDENLSKGILRMLNCDGEKKVFNLLKKEVDEADAMEILHVILPMQRDEAIEYLGHNGLSEEVIKYTNCGQVESFVIAGDELLRKVAILNYYANFDFRKNSDKLNTNDMNYEHSVDYFAEKYNMTEKSARKYANEIIVYDPGEIKGLSFKSDTETCELADDMVICRGGAKINLTSMDASFKGKTPDELIYYDSEKVIRRDYDNQDIDYSVVLLRDGDSCKVFLINTEFDSSVLFSMLFLDGKNLDNFELFHVEKVPQKIYSYRML